MHGLAVRQLLSEAPGCKDHLAQRRKARWDSWQIRRFLIPEASCSGVSVTADVHEMTLVEAGGSLAIQGHRRSWTPRNPPYCRAVGPEECQTIFWYCGPFPRQFTAGVRKSGLRAGARTAIDPQRVFRMSIPASLTRSMTARSSPFLRDVAGLRSIAALASGTEARNVHTTLPLMA